MDEVIEDIVEPNNTDDLTNFSYEPSGWQFFHDIMTIGFTTMGFISDIIIILMIIRTARMRTRTNLLLMHFIMNNACFLVCNVYLWTGILELFGSRSHYTYMYNCVLEYTDLGFQTNECIFLLIIVSNMLIKNKRIQLKLLLIVVYSTITVNFIVTQILCHFRIVPLMALTFAAFILLTFVVVVIKEFNNCYKKWHKKDPLSERTLFRFNIGRIYVGCWLSTICLYLMAHIRIMSFYFCHLLAMHSYMMGFYVLLYIVYNDKNFKICFLNLLRTKGAADYDVDDTTTFADDLSEDSRIGNNDNGLNNENINFNAVENAARTQFHDSNTIQVP